MKTLISHILNKDFDSARTALNEAMEHIIEGKLTEMKQGIDISEGRHKGIGNKKKKGRLAAQTRDLRNTFGVAPGKTRRAGPRASLEEEIIKKIQAVIDKKWHEKSDAKDRETIKSIDKKNRNKRSKFGVKSYSGRVLKAKKQDRKNSKAYKYPVSVGKSVPSINEMKLRADRPEETVKKERSKAVDRWLKRDDKKSLKDRVYNKLTGKDSPKTRVNKLHQYATDREDMHKSVSAMYASGVGKRYKNDKSHEEEPHKSPKQYYSDMDKDNLKSSQDHYKKSQAAYRAKDKIETKFGNKLKKDAVTDERRLHEGKLKNKQIEDQENSPPFKPDDPKAEKHSSASLARRAMKAAKKKLNEAQGPKGKKASSYYGPGRKFDAPSKKNGTDEGQKKQFEKDSDKGWDEYDKNMRENTLSEMKGKGFLNKGIFASKKRKELGDRIDKKMDKEQVKSLGHKYGGELFNNKDYDDDTEKLVKNKKYMRMSMIGSKVKYPELFKK